MKSDLSEIDPLTRARAVATKEGALLIDSLTNTLKVPADQPLVASGLLAMVNCMLTFSSRLGECKPEFARLIHQATQLAAVLRDHAEQIQGASPPAAQLHLRQTDYPAWALFLRLQPQHTPICVAAGAAICLALLDRTTLSNAYCTQLRRDIKVFGTPIDSMVCAEDLEKQQFGRAWSPRFQRIDKEVRQRVVLRTPPPDEAPSTSSTLADLLRSKLNFPQIDQRRGIRTDAHLTDHQLRRAASELREKVEQGDDESALVCLALCSGLSGKSALRIPLEHQGLAAEGMCLDVANGRLLVDLDHMFPHRQRAPANGAGFEPAGDVLNLPLPHFLIHSIRSRVTALPQAGVFADLLTCAALPGWRNLVEEEQSALGSSLARMRRTMPLAALERLDDRLLAAAITLDFSLIGAARMYYARLSGEEIDRNTAAFLDSIGWGPAAQSPAPILDSSVGSHVVPTNAHLKKHFAELAETVRKSNPGRRSGVDPLFAHHVAYGRYTAAMLTFCIGAREASPYPIRANQVRFGQCEILLRDKNRNDDGRAMEVPLNARCQLQIRHWLAHCEALKARLLKLGGQEAIRMALALDEVCKGAPVPLVLLPRPGATPAAIGSSDVYGAAPRLDLPPNVGRHYWQNALRRRGLSSFDIDTFMRHRVIGLESMTSSCNDTLHDRLERIRMIQEQILEELSIDAVPGLRSAV